MFCSTSSCFLFLSFTIESHWAVIHDCRCIVGLSSAVGECTTPGDIRGRCDGPTLHPPFSHLWPSASDSGLSSRRHRSFYHRRRSIKTAYFPPRDAKTVGTASVSSLRCPAALVSEQICGWEETEPIPRNGRSATQSSRDAAPIRFHRSPGTRAGSSHPPCVSQILCFPRRSTCPHLPRTSAIYFLQPTKPFRFVDCWKTIAP